MRSSLPCAVRLTLAALLVVTLFNPVAAQVSVTISPSTITLGTMATQPFTATVSGSSNTGVTWQVNGVSGGSSANGLISTTVLNTSNEALYLAPSSVPSPASISVTAISQADSTKSATATVTIQLPSRSGNTYYVSTSGNDSNAGTSSAPWRHINYAASKAQAGDTVQVAAGTYNELVTIPNSGNSTSGYISFIGAPGAIVDGTGLTPTGQQGLFSLEGAHSYIIIQGFEIRNFSASGKVVPVGIDFEGTGSNIEFLNNHIHNIVIGGSTCNGANGLGVAVYGTGSTATTQISNLTFYGNELDHNVTGCSENVSFDGNVQYWVMGNNYVHNANNICLDNIGFEGVSSNASYDQARDGWVFQNKLDGCTSTSNPVYKNKVGADGYYCDGCTRVIVERNIISNSDLSEMASEHAGHVSSYVIFRNNIIYNSLYIGLSIGGYSSHVGGSDHIVIVNNSLWDDGTFGSSGQGEFQIQYNATNNTVENNIFDDYTLSTKYLVYDYTSSQPSPAVLDYNVEYDSAGASGALYDWQGKSITGFSAYKTASGQEAHSQFADPLYANITTQPYNFDLAAGSPAVNAGTNLGVNTVGVLDYAGNARVNGSGQINVGAYEQ